MKLIVILALGFMVALVLMLMFRERPPRQGPGIDATRWLGWGATSGLGAESRGSNHPSRHHSQAGGADSGFEGGGGHH